MVCLSVCLLVSTVSPAKSDSNRSRWCLGCGLVRPQRTVYWGMGARFAMSRNTFGRICPAVTAVLKSRNHSQGEARSNEACFPAISWQLVSTCSQAVKICTHFQCPEPQISYENAIHQLSLAVFLQPCCSLARLLFYRPTHISLAVA